MPKGGARPGAGRKPGQRNKKTAELQAKIEAEGITPLAYMLAILRDTDANPARRDEMAKAAAPYVHAKLAAVEHSGTIDQRHTATDMTDEQLAAIAAGRSTGAATTPPSPRQLN